MATFLAGIHFLGLFFDISQRDVFCRIGLIGNRAFCAGLNTPGIVPAKIADIDKLLEQLDGTNRAGLFTGPAERTQGRGYSHLSLCPHTQGMGRTSQTVAFLTLPAGHRPVNTLFVQINHFDPGLSITDFSGVEERTGRLTSATASAFGDINLYH